MNIFSQLKSEWHPTPPKDLLECPPTVLKGIEESQAEALAEIFHIRTLGEMVRHPTVDWVWRTFEAYRSGRQPNLPRDAADYLADSWLERSCGEWLGAPLNSLKDLTNEEGLRLGAALQWVTIRSMAGDPAFAAAREISRIVTGEPVAPGQDEPPPLVNYFEGASHKYLQREREKKGLPPIPPPPPYVSPEPSVVTAAPAASGSEASTASGPAASAASPPAGSTQTASPLPGVTVVEPAPGSLATHGSPVEPRRESPFGGVPVPQSASSRKDYASDGAYIPRGGGSRGWFENQGVAKTERRNNYRYQDAIDQMGYRHTGIEDRVHVNLRGAERKEVRIQVRYDSGDTGAPMPALCLDISLTGAKIRIGRILTDGSRVALTYVQRDDIRGFVTPFLSLQSEVMWCRPVDLRYRNPRYDCGLVFVEMTIEEKEQLSKVLMDRVDELLEAQWAAEEAEGRDAGG